MNNCHLCQERKKNLEKFVNQRGIKNRIAFGGSESSLLQIG